MKDHSQSFERIKNLSSENTMMGSKYFLHTVLALVYISRNSDGFGHFPRLQKTANHVSPHHLSESENIPSSSRAEGIKAFQKALNVVAAGLTLGTLAGTSTAKAAEPKISLSPLPYDYKSLMPYISEKTLLTHHDKHHAKYVSTTLAMIKGTDLEGADLVTVMKNARGTAPVLFNNAAQSWNHDFYWKCMTKGGGGAPSGDTATMINKNFGSYEQFKTQVSPTGDHYPHLIQSNLFTDLLGCFLQFAAAGNTAFGSGWAWLVQNKDGKLEILKTIGAENPILDNKKPLLTMDVWEHAYYLDYQNNRGLYVDAFLDHLVNWNFVESQMAKKA